MTDSQPTAVRPPLPTPSGRVAPPAADRLPADAPAAPPAREKPAMNDVPKPATPPTPAKPAASTRRRVLMFGVPAAIVLVSLILYLAGGRYVSTDDAYVRQNLLTVSTDVAGTVVEVGVHNNQSVVAGQLLYRLDDETYRINVAAAEAQLALVADNVQSMRASYQQKLAEVLQAGADSTFYQKEYNRVQPLVASNAATPSQVDAAQRNLSAAIQRRMAAHQEADSILASLGGSYEVQLDQYPPYRQAQAQLERARRDLAHTRVVAQTAGIVTQVDSLRPGMYLTLAQPAMVLVEADELWVDANLKETDLTNVQAGQLVRVLVDTYPNHAWTGRVETISPATGAQFSLLPAQNSSGNWVKVVQRIPVRISIPIGGDQGGPMLRAGMSVTVEIDTEHRHSLGGLLRSVGRWFGLG